MPHLGPIKRRNLIYYLRQVGFEGPYPDGNHQYMVKRKENITLTIPNLHQSDIGEGLLVRILK
jgi:predicted RNA binding protein YcfA (HicA-like mRNA interferase family)